MCLTTAAGTPASRLGLGAREDRYPEAVARAAERGVNLFFFYQLGAGAWANALRELAMADRSGVVITTGSGARSADGLRRSLEAYLDALGTDYLDAFFIEYVRPDEEPSDIHGDRGALAELSRWKNEGTIRYVGATAHDRVVSRRLAEDERIDVLMQRYNMAHRKVADEVLPVCRENGVTVASFTATRWGSLLAGHPEWDDEPPDALDCYRYCVAHSAIDIVLAAPKNERELAADVALLHAPPMTRAEVEHWERYGDLVYGDGNGSFETDWP